MVYQGYYRQLPLYTRYSFSRKWNYRSITTGLSSGRYYNPKYRLSAVAIFGIGCGAIYSFYVYNKRALSDQAPEQSAALTQFRNLQLLKRKKEIEAMALAKAGNPKTLLKLVYKSFTSIRFKLVAALKTASRICSLLVIFAPCVLLFPVWYIAFRPCENSELDPRTGTLDADSQSQRAPLSSKRIWWVLLFAKTLEYAGPTFVKLGQWMTSRTDVFPPYFCSVCSRLQSGSSPHSLYQTLEMLRAELGCAPEVLFDRFEKEPIGVGAIAQVYRARLKAHTVPAFFDRCAPLHQAQYDSDTIPDPIEVAVKVLHPNVYWLVDLDLRILCAVGYLLDHISLTKWMSPLDEIHTFATMMRAQLDMRHEAHCLDVFNYHFRHRQHVLIPSPVYPYVTSQVLIEKFEPGVSMTQFLEFGPTPDDKDLARIGQKAFLQMLITDNFVHADLHPGNLLVVYGEPLSLWRRFEAQINDFWSSFLVETRPSFADRSAIDESEAFALALANQQRNLRSLKFKRSANEKWFDLLRKSKNASEFRAVLETMRISDPKLKPYLVMIDAGLVSELSDTNLQNFLDMFEALVSFDGRQVAKLIVERSKSPETVVDPRTFMKSFQDILDQLRSTTLVLSHVRMADMLLQVFDNVRRHHVKLEGEFINVALSTLLVEGMARRLDPDLDLLRGAVPLLAQRPKVQRYIVNTAIENTKNVLIDAYSAIEEGSPKPERVNQSQFGIFDPVYWNLATWVLFGRNWNAFVSMWYDESGLLQLEDLVSLFS